MYMGDLKYQFLDFIENEYEHKCNKQSLPSFKKNHERDIAIIALILGTGIRVSECVGVNVRNINLNT